MNGHQKRAIKIENHIKRSALELINTHGPAKVVLKSHDMQMFQK